MDPRADGASATAAEAAAPALALRQGGGDAGGHQQARAENLHERAPLQPKIVAHALRNFLVSQFSRWIACMSRSHVGAFGFRISAFFRISDFGFRPSPSAFRKAPRMLG